MTSEDTNALCLLVGTLSMAISTHQSNDQCQVVLRRIHLQQFTTPCHHCVRTWPFTGDCASDILASSYPFLPIPALTGEIGYDAARRSFAATRHKISIFAVNGSSLIH